MKKTEEIMTIIHTENNHTEINILEEHKITKGATSPSVLNDIISTKNDQLFKVLQ